MNRKMIKLAVFASCVAVVTSTVLAWGELTTLRTIQTQTMLIRHKATELQRRAAENNARIFFKQLTPEKKAELKKKKVRVVLIRTTRSRETLPAAKDVRMRYSLEGESLIDDYAYEFQAPLQAGTIAKATGFDPEYVGQ
jgi:predicted Zn-dependent protease